MYVSGGMCVKAVCAWCTCVGVFAWGLQSRGYVRGVCTLSMCTSDMLWDLCMGVCMHVGMCVGYVCRVCTLAMCVLQSLCFDV